MIIIIIISMSLSLYIYIYIYSYVHIYIYIYTHIYKGDIMSRSHPQTYHPPLQQVSIQLRCNPLEVPFVWYNMAHNSLRLILHNIWPLSMWVNIASTTMLAPGPPRGSRSALGEHKPGRIKPGRIERAAVSLRNRNYHYLLLFDTTPFILLNCCLIPRWYIILLSCFLIRPRWHAPELDMRQISNDHSGCVVLICWYV